MVVAKIDARPNDAIVAVEGVSFVDSVGDAVGRPVSLVSSVVKSQSLNKGTSNRSNKPCMIWIW